MAEMEWNPEIYLREIRIEFPRFDEFQDTVAEATRGVEADAVLELGVGTGETSRRVRARQDRKSTRQNSSH